LAGGLVRCATCGQGMHKSSNGRRYQILRCDTPGNGHPTISYEKASDYIVSLAFSHLGPMKRTPGGDPAEREALAQAVEEARALYVAAEELLGTKPPEDSKPALALAEAQSRLAQLDAEATRPLGLTDVLTPLGVRKEFEKLPIPEQRRVLRTIIKQAVLAPGRAHIGERLTVEFADGSTWPAPPGEGPVFAA
jgi:hypothetical protein